jgi:hypothetical protein
MSRVERFFERLVERPSARIFRTRLQPVQVLRRIERSMENNRGSDGHPDVVPDRFAVRLHPDDVASMGPLDGVAADLASGALAFARSHGLVLRERPRVGFYPDRSLPRGEVEIEAKVSRPPEPQASQATSDTRVFEVPVVTAPAATLEVREPNRVPRSVRLEQRPTRIGRSTECELVLRDPRVSRQHARVHARDGHIVLTDLGSTNGTRVNGQRVREVVLGAGDRITMGDTVIVVAGTGSR